MSSVDPFYVLGGMLDEQVLPWFLSSGAKIVLILVIAFLINRSGRLLIEKIVRKAVRPDRFSSRKAEKKREDTIISVFYGTLRILIWLVALMVLLSEIGVDIKPLLTAVGVSGLAIGFGGQYLIRDIISGLFILLENQYRIGDVVTIGDTTGDVEDITLRMTILRDLDGTVHHIPNGEITKASNLSKSFSGINLDIGVSYDADLNHVQQVIDRVGQELAQDAKWKKSITQAPYFVRVDNLGDYAVIIKVLGRTKPLEQWDVTGELRKRIKLAFDQEGIEIPYPQRVVHRPDEKNNSRRARN